MKTTRKSSTFRTDELCHRDTESTEKSTLTSSLCPLWLCGLLCLCSGCSPYLQAQIDLAGQTRKGVAMISRSLDAKQETLERFQHSQRLRIDNAFDADVREQEVLTSDWVIDHRRAYEVALDALNEQSNRVQLSHESDQKTLAAMDLALQKLEWLSSIPMQSGGTP